ncbi:STAS/SEC14 domain-containing protein [Echinicola soli]|uniref:STAS/SEC14 domain-containing protein n=1 Tax=Echinicola soli TaxID=2591634 RepID=A0A514CN65_9BACT|nr:STAS/SEC14 domain-containing protein [Echinicola soli]QDH81230.1 STAS/SEC14 domain-containing protein [Echinicola soli]
MDTITTRTQEFRLLQNGIIHTRILPNLSLTLDDGRENLTAVSTITGNKPAYLMVDISKVKGISSECRDLFCSKDAAKVQHAVGMVSTSSMGRMIGNFFLGFNRPPFPIRIFADHSEALSWLTTIKNGQGK